MSKAFQNHYRVHNRQVFPCENVHYINAEDFAVKMFKLSEFYVLVSGWRNLE